MSISLSIAPLWLHWTWVLCSSFTCENNFYNAHSLSIYYYIFHPLWISTLLISRKAISGGKKKQFSRVVWSLFSTISSHIFHHWQLTQEDHEWDLECNTCLLVAGNRQRTRTRPAVIRSASNNPVEPNSTPFTMFTTGVMTAVLWSREERAFWGSYKELQHS